MHKCNDKTTTAVVAFITGLAAVLVLLFTAVESVVMDPARYEAAYVRHCQAEAIGIDSGELTRITGELLDYLHGDRDTLDGTFTLAGVEREVYSEREKLHMADVRVLFQGGYTIRNVAAVFLAGGILVLALLCRKAFWRTLFRGYLAALALFGVLGAALGIAVAVDFTGVFIAFHHLFFTNDLWLLSANDMLIMMFPEVFFHEMTVSILARTAIFLVLPVCAWVSGCVAGKVLDRRKQHAARV